MGKINRKRLLVPGFLFQSIVIGGGYGTGAEISQYFQHSGFVGGLLGMAVTTVIWSVLCAVTFAFARAFQVYDYRSMMRRLTGETGHLLFELSYIALMLMVLGVVNATAAAMASHLLGVPPWCGVAVVSLGVVALVLGGTEAIEKALSAWSYVLYAVYAVFAVICLRRFGGTIGAEWAVQEIGSGWALRGAQYAFYNLGCVPLVLYTVRQCRSRTEAVLSGLLAGVIGVLPAALLLVVLVGVPSTVGAEVPVAEVFDALQLPWLYAAFEIVLCGTLIETGTGFLKAIDDRIEVAVEQRLGFVPRGLRGAVTVIGVASGIAVSGFGLTAIIEKGYGSLCWAFALFFALPMMTLGVWKLLGKRQNRNK